MAATGCGVDEVWNSIRAGKSGLKPLTLFQSPRYGQIPAGEIQQDLLALGAPSHGSRSDQLGWLAAREAIADAKINLTECADRAGIVLGCSVGGSFDGEPLSHRAHQTGEKCARGQHVFSRMRLGRGFDRR